MMKKLYIALWNWQNRHTTPRWVSLNTGEIVSTFGRLLAGERDRENGFQYVWVSLMNYNAGMYDDLLAGNVESVTGWIWD